MQNPFNHENYPSNELKRNTFPCSFQNNLTMKYGYIYPAGIWRTVPGATYKIKPTLGLNFMPTTFPVQTRQKVYVHYFYGRDRNFWKDYKDFVNGQRPDLVKPYIDESVTQARTGKLLDYLGVPTTIIGNFGQYEDKGSFALLAGTDYDFMYTTYGSSDVYASDGNIKSISNFLDDLEGSTISTISRSSIPAGYNNAVVIDVTNFLSSEFSKIRVSSDDIKFLEELSETTGNNVPYKTPSPRELNTVASTSCFCLVDSNNKVIKVFPFSSIEEGAAVYDYSYDGSIQGLRLLFLLHTSAAAWYYNAYNPDTGVSLSKTISLQHNYNFKLYNPKSSSEVLEIDSSTSPYWGSDRSDLRERIKLNAYLPRFYETVYNLYYRNPQNNPYILDGRPEYNKFIPSKDGGLDSNLYELRRRNWEDDFLTTAVQSPQQGIAPLVGLTDRGATLTLTNEDGTVTRYNVTTTDNGSITGIEANDTNPEPVLTKALIDAVSYGISIEDIRNVNAMQKWLELNLRKGYQYKDIIQARWGISISYNELDLPEFIGGFTQDVQLQAVTQTANVNDDVTGQLGWQAGRLFASGEGREITHYCDEEGFIMCLITVVPVPNYSQLLSKHWFDRDLLDSYQPEFNHIGFQPITYKEVCPVQAFQESTENVNVLEQTFGYQRPWYQYFNYTDEVHGQFRTSFKDFLINRVFDVKPELSESFLLIDPKQINDVFNVPDADDDKIIGAIYHSCVAKLPISLYAQARLE